MDGGPPRQRYFLPDDWVLEHARHQLVATRLSSGEVLSIDGESADALLAQTLNPSTWEVMARHEPILGDLFSQVSNSKVVPLTRASLLKGAGWRQLFLELTARCNERCVHCYAGSSPERSEALEWQELRDALDDAKNLGFQIVQLTGGDPLISPHCIAAVEYAREIGIEGLEVYTNGLALRGKIYERLRELGVSFAFSFYSHDPDRHDAITQTPGSHVRTSRAIRQAADDGLHVRTGSVIMDENHGDAAPTHDYLVQLGVKPEAIGFDQSRDVGRGKTPQAVDYPQTQGIEQALGPRRAFGGSAAVGYDGIVYPCIFSRHLPLGSIRESSLLDILRAPEPVGTVPDDFAQQRAAWAAKLSCWECQTRSLLLGGRNHG